MECQWHVSFGNKAALYVSGSTVGSCSATGSLQAREHYCDDHDLRALLFSACGCEPSAFATGHACAKHALQDCVRAMAPKITSRSIRRCRRPLRGRSACLTGGQSRVDRGPQSRAGRVVENYQPERPNAQSRWGSDRVDCRRVMPCPFWSWHRGDSVFRAHRSYVSGANRYLCNRYRQTCPS
jgi:hypothetical protein